MLIATADIGGDDLDNHAVVALAIAEGEFGKWDRLHLDTAGAHVDDTAIALTHG
jgi:hypothetical protein